ncbi:unnamed protein product [Caenorhabditis bovis]|uniref:Uncharacterized protein n=1 Tax=Caenorhabditis bovis TaxID=2654633 RepID=A0A8S1EWU1_9PELO|nr:unnamed protein product [Caenorhabditis bovis]
MGEIAERYYEQILTTLETMRRRCIAYYDGIFYIGRKVAKAAERLKEIAEPATYDARDFIVQSCAETDPLQNIETESKNNVVEMYLGISVILIGFAGGQLSGAYAMSPIIEHFFDAYVEILVLLAIPAFVFFNIRKNVSLDDHERRTTLFSSTMFFGVLLGHLMGPRLLSIAPSVMFATPLLFALAFDNGVVPTGLPALSRHTFFYIFSVITVFVTTIVAAFVLGYFTFVGALFNILHAAGLFLHFQIIMQYVKDKSFMVGESQMAYVGTIIVVQVIFATIFGSNPHLKSK